MFPIVVGLGDGRGVAAGWAASVMPSTSSPDFVKGLRLFFTGFDVRYGLVKAASFGAAVTLIGCMNGMRASGGAEGVGQAATRAVVYSAINRFSSSMRSGPPSGSSEGSMKRTNDFVVGLTLLLGAAIIVGATLWVKQTGLRNKHERVAARFRDVGSVRVGAAVVLRGVNAGRVQRIELGRDGWVDVTMALDPNVELPKDPVVLLNESSLFGEWQATITEEAENPRDETVSRQIADARAAGGEMLPGATLPDIAQLTAVAGRIAGDVASVASRSRSRSRSGGAWLRKDRSRTSRRFRRAHSVENAIVEPQCPSRTSVRG